MKKFPVLKGAAVVCAVLLVAIVTPATFAQGMGPCNMGPETMRGQGGYGPGTLLPGYGVGGPGGMMQQSDLECGGPGVRDDQGMIGGWGYIRFGAIGQRLTATQVQQGVVTYLAGYYNNPDLAVVELMAFEHNIYARVAEKSTKINACELLIDPYTGAVQPEYGPTRMWNTKYGQRSAMGGMMPSGMIDGLAPVQPTAVMPVTAAQASKLAQQYLNTQKTSLTIAKGLDIFYGYYTVRSLDKAGNTVGMLSVNGYTGQVWDHIWHGKFVGVANGM